MKKFLLLIMLVASALLLAACSSTPIVSSDETNPESLVPEIDFSILTPQESCDALGGSWIESAQECESISKDSCDLIGGNFNECASACRNDPNEQICTMQCVLVCEFDSKTSLEPTDEVHVCTQEEIARNACTREYDPVCGDNGETYSNPCTACSSDNIGSWIQGGC